MYAVIQTGGKQYKVTEGQVLHIEKLAAEAGDKLTFDQVLMVGGEGDVKLGAPLLDGASVTAEVIKQARSPKVIVFKKMRRKGYQRKQGHRQDYTEVKIKKIQG